ncbi:hypothetical protein [Carboxylicivirga marina]|uniref:hypothetical protein n=1 Tax=Carboxylicivirga marina TaxID=2800988 RepID=UPI0025981641|nr:hypothetical protein [uncultured Carboxylicivirga sp.]
MALFNRPIDDYKVDSLRIYDVIENILEQKDISKKELGEIIEANTSHKMTPQNLLKRLRHDDYKISFLSDIAKALEIPLLNLIASGMNTDTPPLQEETLKSENNQSSPHEVELLQKEISELKEELTRKNKIIDKLLI